jgi:methionyl-tRNA formyltransferase
MKYLFFGTPEFAAIILEKLVKAELMPEAVICNADKPFGRKQILTPPAVKIAAQKHGLTIYQPKDKIELLQTIKNIKPDLAVVAAFGMIFTKEILDAVPQGFINVHPSLLPRWRGASPIQAAILNNDEETGASLMLLDEKVDHGDIVSSIKYPVSSNDNYETLSKKLAEIGGDLLIDFLRKYENVRKYEKIKGTPQDESQATYAKKIKTEDAFIRPEDLEFAQEEGRDLVIEIDRKIRALNPEPGVWTMKDGKRMKIMEAEITPENKLKLKKIQFEGKKPMDYN